MTGGTGETLDYGIAVPVWRQLAAILRRRIRDGRYQPGRALPSGEQPSRNSGARGTVRKAIALLRDEGLVTTVTGRGSDVADPLPDGNGLSTSPQP